MRHRVVVRALAERDIDEATEHYAMIDASLAGRFLSDFRQTAQRLDRFPFAGREPYRGVRRVALDVFPYHAYYRVVGREVRIIAIIHERRDPVVVEAAVTSRR